MHISQCLSHLNANLLNLEAEFSKDESKRTVWELGKYKAPGPDRFSLFFFRIFWEDTKQDHMHEIVDGTIRLDTINYFLR